MAKEAVNTLLNAVLCSASHVVRRTAISKMKEKKRYAFRRADGRTDLECSRCDRPYRARLAMKEMLDAIAAGVRIDRRLVVVHSITITNCNATKTPMAAYVY